ncbi:MAG TPA: hydantoinase B/oxoprolinase family protein, partial [Candidatus Cybelea sp.]
MTNTLNTPIEALEREFPLRVVRYEIADGTAGSGRYRGGNGLIRALELIEGSAQATLLADRHTLQPPGAAGGAPGACGRHELERDGTAAPLPAKTSFDFRSGDVLTIQTPGGGGYGSEGDVAQRPSGPLETEARRAKKIDDANRAAPG